MIKFIVILMLLWLFSHWWLVPIINSIKKATENRCLREENRKLEDMLRDKL